MRKNKGCVNESCEAHKKKIEYKNVESFCSKCGFPLVYVCKDCYMQLPDENEKYCIRCIAKHQDKKEKVAQVAATVVSAAVAVVTLVKKRH